MSKRQVLMLVGVWVLILAVPGFPSAWRTALLLLTGLGIIAFGYRLRTGEASAPQKDLPFTDYKRPQTQNTEPTKASPVPPAQPTSPDESHGPVA